MDIATIIAELLDADSRISDVGREEVADGTLWIRTSDDQLYELNISDI